MRGVLQSGIRQWLDAQMKKRTNEIDDRPVWGVFTELILVRGRIWYLHSAWWNRELARNMMLSMKPFGRKVCVKKITFQVVQKKSPIKE
jgi:hypothetical protein